MVRYGSRNNPGLIPTFTEVSQSTLVWLVGFTNDTRDFLTCVVRCSREGRSANSWTCFLAPGVSSRAAPASIRACKRAHLVNQAEKRGEDAGSSSLVQVVCSRVQTGVLPSHRIVEGACLVGFARRGKTSHVCCKIPPCLVHPAVIHGHAGLSAPAALALLRSDLGRDSLLLGTRSSTLSAQAPRAALQLRLQVHGRLSKPTVGPLFQRTEGSGPHCHLQDP